MLKSLFLAFALLAGLTALAQADSHQSSEVHNTL